RRSMTCSSTSPAATCATRCRPHRWPTSGSYSAVRHGRLMQRAFAIIERELRRLRRAPMLIAMSLLMPLVQLVILGHAFGGTVRNLKVGLVDQDRGVP